MTGRHTAVVHVLVASLALAVGCASGPGASSDPSRYRLAGDGDWSAVVEDLRPRYPDFLAVVLDASQTREPDIRKVRADLESATLTRERFDALNAVAIAYFELNARAQRGLEEDMVGETYLADSFRATKLLSMPWRAYRDVDDPALRAGILAFYVDIASGDKPYTIETAPRILPLVSSLARTEDDPDRLATIRTLEGKLAAMQPAAP